MFNKESKTSKQRMKHASCVVYKGYHEGQKERRKRNKHPSLWAAASCCFMFALLAMACLEFGLHSQVSQKLETLSQSMADPASPPLSLRPETVSIVDASLQRLHTQNINFVALDFDQTIVDIHTGGDWEGSPQELARHVRPQFWQLITALSQQSNMYVAIVTFSEQVDLIRAVLGQIVGDNEASNTPIRGGEMYAEDGSQFGKQNHLALARQDLIMHHKVSVSSETTLLIDDSRDNILQAISRGTRAILFDPEEPHRIWQDLSML